MDDNLRGSTIDLIIAGEGNPASAYFGGQFKEVTHRYWVTSPCVLKLNTLSYAVRFASDHCKSPHHSHRKLLLQIYLREKKFYKKKLYPYHVVLTTKAKDRWLRSRAKECAQVRFATWPKTFSFLANYNCFVPAPGFRTCVFEKTVYLFR